MTRRATLLRTAIITALLVLTAGTVVAPITLHAQGAIGQPKGDPTGATTGTAADVPVKDAKNPTLAEVMETVGHNRIAINFVWTLLAGFLVMFMQAGFAMVETGFTRAKNAAHTMSMNFMIYRLACSVTGSAATPCRWEVSAP
jgi:Amt family ammonium transporter